MVDVIMNALGTFLYPLFSIVFTLIDILQYIFQAFAGTGSLIFNTRDWIGAGDRTGDLITNGIEDKPSTGAENDTGIVYYLLNNDIVKNMFYSILILALFLLIIFTVMAFIKNVYSSKQKKWQDIIGDSLKGLANFVFIPICCLLGVWLGNILLNAINAATTREGNSAISAQLFVCCAYNANNFRNGTYKDEDVKEGGEGLTSIRYVYNKVHGSGGDTVVKAGQPLSYYAELADKLYATNKVDLHWYGNVRDCYSLSQINYVLLVAGGIFMCNALISLAYGMVRRLFILLMLYIISPALCAMYPLDGGSAVGSWKKDFIKHTISAYGAVAGMNLFFSLSPLIQNIRLNNSFVDDVMGITPLLLTICGLYVVKEFVSMISGYIGAENALTAGESLRKNVRSSVKKYGEAGAKNAAGMTGAFAKAIGVGIAHGGKAGVGAAFKSLGGSLLSAGDSAFKGITGVDIHEFENKVESSYKEGKSKEKNKIKEKENINSLQSAITTYNDAKQKYLDDEKHYNDMAAILKDSKSTDDEKKVAQDWLDAYEHNKNQMNESLAQMQHYSEVLGLSEKLLKNMAKRSNMSPEELKSNMEKGSEYTKNKKAYDAAKDEQARLEHAVTGTAEEFEKVFGSKLNDMATNADVTAKTLQSMMLSGMKLETDPYKIAEEMNKVGRTARRFDSTDEDVINVAAARMQVNKSIERVANANANFESAGANLVNAVLSANGKIYGENGKIEAKFDPAELTALKDAIANGLDISNNPIVETLEKTIVAQNEQAKEEAKNLKDIKKAVEELKASNKKKS